ncbi:restriction endonuclease subunit S [Acinetobacter junii]|uniref:restriction endonuclease subunit S n=1 Tax=Acinetobacter junii TaxID=40215 RepID=UPI000F67AC70|nr:restriction endonuclease subunit S [Acinetobacter junii]RSE34294.1 restriction endonuclease subunit S [Acinetobacter junii]
MSEWLLGKLGDIAEIVMGQSPTGESVNTDGLGTPLLNGPTEFTIRYPQAVQFSTEPKRFSKVDDILFCVRGSTTGRMNWANASYAIGRGLAAIRHKQGKEYRYFVKAILDYYLDTMLASASGSTFPNVSKDQLNDLEISYPPLPEQKAIASVLSSLDDKIDLLHRQNKTLEAMAETLFRQWFIEEAKEDWDEVQVKDFVALNKVSVSKSYPHTEIEYLDTGSLTEGVIGELQNYQLAEAPSRAKRLVQHNDILISTVRPNQCHYGIISEPQFNLVVSTGFCTITCERISPYFVYLLLTNKEMTEYLHSVAEGSTSTYPSLKPEDIGSVSFQLPPKELIQQFHDLAESYWQKIHKNHKQIQILEKLRDTLLPKLMSGEVRVQYQTEEVA